jgi:predicted amidohydrolase
MKFRNHLYVLVGLLTFSLLISHNGYSQRQTTKQTPFVIKNVNVITMTSSNTILENATVIISNNLIQSINGAIPKNATTIDGKGKWLIPGLIDMHVHIPTDGGPFGPKNTNTRCHFVYGYSKLHDAL